MVTSRGSRSIYRRSGSRETYTLTVDAFEREPQGYVSGKLVIAVERADGDPVSARTGAITVEFAAPLIGERIAECNHDGDQACLLLE